MQQTIVGRAASEYIDWRNIHTMYVQLVHRSRSRCENHEAKMNGGRTAKLSPKGKLETNDLFTSLSTVHALYRNHEIVLQSDKSRQSAPPQKLETNNLFTSLSTVHK